MPFVAGRKTVEEREILFRCHGGGKGSGKQDRELTGHPRRVKMRLWGGESPCRR